MIARTALAAALLAGLAACASAPRDPWPDAAGDVRDPELADVCVELWQERLAADPIGATRLGDPRFHGELPPPTPERAERETAALRDLHARLAALDEGELTPADALTRRVLLDDLTLQLERSDLAADPDAWTLDPLYGEQATFLSLSLDQPAGTPRERAQLLERWRRMAPYLDQMAANLRRGLAAGRAAPRAAAVKVLGQLEAALATPPEESPLFAPAASGGAAFARELRGVVAHEIYPALARLAAVVRDEVLPEARPDERPGLLALDGGPEYYLWCIRRHTTLELSPDQVHLFGMAELERVRNELRELGQRALGTDDLAEIQRRLRGDPDMHFRSAEEVEVAARDALERARAALDGAFGLRPRAGCEVVPIPAHEAPDSTVGYYQQPAADGSRPGRYFVNTHAPTTRTRYEAEVLAYHESIPGHHLQIAVAQELEGLPLVRRHGGVSAYVEGWALYTERLADELGLYSSDVDRLGVLSFDAWRASRLVVDTGLHHLGWSRERAIEFLLANTLLAENNVVNEVDRYIAWPGQALAYKIGQREVLNLRAAAEERLGPAFALADFHDVVLESGPVPLEVLRERVEAWLDAPRSADGPPVEGP